MAGVQLAIAPQLHQSTHMTRGLKEHGIVAPQLDLREFNANVKSVVDARHGTVVLLVDSVKARQTRTFLDNLEQSLDTNITTARSWVHVFDWRVLHAISRSEDQSDPPTGFDGFSGPWRRWHIGII